MNNSGHTKELVSFINLIRKEKPKEKKAVRVFMSIKSSKTDLKRLRKVETEDRFNDIIKAVEEFQPNATFPLIHAICNKNYSQGNDIDSRLDLFSDIHDLINIGKIVKERKRGMFARFYTNEFMGSLQREDSLSSPRRESCKKTNIAI